jgi:acyl carrier protein
MDTAGVRAAVLATLKTIAPELKEDELKSDRPLRAQVDLDSMDWLNVIIALHEKLKIDIPESDYNRLATLDAIVLYLAEKLG